MGFWHVDLFFFYLRALALALALAQKIMGTGVIRFGLFFDRNTKLRVCYCAIERLHTYSGSLVHIHDESSAE